MGEQPEGPIGETGCTLHHIRLYETENNYADYYGGEDRTAGPAPRCYLAGHVALQTGRPLRRGRHRGDG